MADPISGAHDNRHETVARPSADALPSGKPHYLDAGTSEEMRETGELAAFEEWIGRQRDIDRPAQRRIVRLAERALDTLGAETINQAFDDLDTFEYRLVLVRPEDYGYKSYLTKTFKNAVRHLTAWAYGLEGEDARRIIDRPHATARRARELGYEPFVLKPADAAADRAEKTGGPAPRGSGAGASRRASGRGSRRSARTAETARRQGQRAAHSESAAEAAPRREEAARAERSELSEFTRRAGREAQQASITAYIAQINARPEEARFEDLEQAIFQHADAMHRLGLLDKALLFDMFVFMMPSINPDAKYALIKQMPGGTGRTIEDVSVLERNPCLHEFMNVLLFDRIFPRLKARFGLE